MNRHESASFITRFAARRQPSHWICILAVVCLAFISRDNPTLESAYCPNQALAQKLADENRLRGGIDTDRYEAVHSVFLKELTKSNPEVCPISDGGRGSFQSYPAYLYRQQTTGKYYLVFDGDFGRPEQQGFGPIED